MKQRRDDAEGQVHPGAGIADLGAGHGGRPVEEPGGGRPAAGALGDVFIDLAVREGPGAETLHAGIDHARVEFLDALPAETHAVERPGGEVLDQHVAGLDQAFQHDLALLVLGIQGDRALVGVQHGEIERIHVRYVAQLAAGDIADSGPFHLDHVSPEPSQKLGAGGARLDMGEVQNFDAF